MYNNIHLWASATSVGDLLSRWLYGPTVSIFLLISTVLVGITSVKVAYLLFLDRCQTTLKNPPDLCALKVWDDFNTHLFIYSHPRVWFVEFMLLGLDDSHGKRRQVFLNEVASPHKGNYGQFYISRLE